MPDAARSTRIEPVSDGRFKVSGPLTFASARRACEAGIEAFAGAAAGASGSGANGTLLVDCGAVTAADSAGVAVLIEWRRWAQGQGRTLRFDNLPQAVQGISRFSGLEGVLGDGAA